MKHVWTVARAALLVAAVFGGCFAPAVAQMLSQNRAATILREEFEHTIEAPGPGAAAAAEPGRPVAPAPDPAGPCSPSPEPDYLADFPTPPCDAGTSAVARTGATLPAGNDAPRSATSPHQAEGAPTRRP